MGMPKQYTLERQDMHNLAIHTFSPLPYDCSRALEVLGEDDILPCLIIQEAVFKTAEADAVTTKHITCCKAIAEEPRHQELIAVWEELSWPSNHKVTEKIGQVLSLPQAARKASMGSSRAARSAGTIPKIGPTGMETMSPKPAAGQEIRASQRPSAATA